MRLLDKVILISDAASDSGKAIAEAFAKEGAILALNGGSDMGLPADKTAYFSYTPWLEEQAEALVAAVVERFGRIDGLVHNHNQATRLSLLECTDEQFEEALDVNAKSAFLLTCAAGRRMKEAGGGAILYISSIHDEKPTGSTFAYSIAKGAVKMLARETALNLAPYGVRTNVINMGPVQGDDLRFISSLTRTYECLEQRIPLEQVGNWEQLAQLAIPFMGEECSWLNGADIRLDGGFYLQYIPQQRYEEWEAAKR